MKLLPLVILPAAALALTGCAGTSHPMDKSYFIDVHELGPGKVTVEAVAQAHRKDLAVQHRHDVRFLKYWVDEVNGRVLCLSEAPDPEAVVATHREAHGLLPATVARVTQGH